MSEPLSATTKAVLLLTAPLLVGRGGRGDGPRPLTLAREYSVLARRLVAIGREPGELLGPERAAALDECLGEVSAGQASAGEGRPGKDGIDAADEGARAAAGGAMGRAGKSSVPPGRGRDVEPLPPSVDRARLEALLARGFRLSLALEQWQARGIWAISRADAGYPRLLKDRLCEKSPPVLYGCGEQSLLDAGGLAVVGPRDAGPELLAYTREVGELAARAGRPVVSGAARGVDQTAMTGALEAGGRAVGVLHSDLAGASTRRGNRYLLLCGQLLLVSQFDPSVRRFHVQNAMERNHVIYGLADAALVVDALVDKGGTRAGARAQLERNRRRAERGRGGVCPIWVRSVTEEAAPGEVAPRFGEGARAASAGLAALESFGARGWPDPATPEEFQTVLDDGWTGSGRVRQVRDDDLRQATGSGEAGGRKQDAAQGLWSAVRLAAWNICREPRSRKDFASALGLSEAQAKEWLPLLLDEGVLRLERRRHVAGEAPAEAGPQVDDRRFCGATTCSDRLLAEFQAVLAGMPAEPFRVEEVAGTLRLTLTQARRWLNRLAERDMLRKLARPVRFVWSEQAGSGAQTILFAAPQNGRPATLPKDAAPRGGPGTSSPADPDDPR